MAELRIGTCSWKFPSWVGLVYSTPKGAPSAQQADTEARLAEAGPLFEASGAPPDADEVESVGDDAKRARYLVEYAQQYNTVEIDQWFWSLFGPETLGLPDPADAEAYRAAVTQRSDGGAGFRVTVKAPNSVTLTHFYQQGDEPLRPNPHFLSTELFASFVARIAPLHPLLGPIMFQFEYLNKQKMQTQARFQALFGDFCREVRERLSGEFTYGLEVRNPQYLNRAYFQFLQAFELIPVLVQGYWMPDIRAVYDAWREMLWNHPAVVIRLMGPDRQAIEKLAPTGWHEIVLPKDDELPGIAKMVEELLDRDLDVYVNVNNHYEGSSPLTIAKLRDLLNVSDPGRASSPRGPGT
ncbi:MAG: DUF72 domain-containing protein [Anaerolineae bacterium]